MNIPTMKPIGRIGPRNRAMLQKAIAEAKARALQDGSRSPSPLSAGPSTSNAQGQIQQERKMKLKKRELEPIREANASEDLMPLVKRAWDPNTPGWVLFAWHGTSGVYALRLHIIYA
jgi:hypothetical protein